MQITNHLAAENNEQEVLNNQMFAEWNYSEQEWNEYVAIERKNKKEDNLYFGIGVFILGTLALILLRSTTILVAMFFAAFFAWLMPFLRMRFSYPHLKSSSQASVQFYASKIIANEKPIKLRNTKQVKHRWLQDVELYREKNKSLFIEFDVHWNTGKGPTSDEFRFLVPKQKEHEAEELLKLYGFE